MYYAAKRFAHVVVLLLIVALTFPAAIFAQKGKSPDRKVPTLNGPGVSELIYAVTSSNALVSFNSATPGTLLSNVAISGLQTGELIYGIDFRPVTRQLYLLGSTSRIYVVNRSTGAATAVNVPFTPVLSGNFFGLDFNPTVDRIRVVSDTDQNLRLNPDLGTVQATDTNLAYAMGDAHFGANPNVVGSAYANNFAGATTTTLYGIDSVLDILVNQIPPNNGTLNTAGNLGFDTTDLVGFDISRTSGIAYASMTAAVGGSSLFQINLATGAATLVGAIGAGVTILDISVAPIALNGDLLISEFRLRGSGGPSDEFVEIYNPSSQPFIVATFDGSSGFAMAASAGGTRFIIPNGTVIPPRSHYLGVNSAAYSLGSYPAGNGTTATGDATYTTEIPDNTGIALFNTSTAGNFTLANRLDAVGPNTEANPIYLEGTGYPPLGVQSLEQTFFRNLRSGVPQDTNNNFASGAAEVASATPQNDFVFADTTATLTAAGARLGAPGPENLSSPIQRSSTIKASLVATCISSALAPNRVRTGSGNTGTLEIRRRFTNNTGGSVTRLRFRIVDITGPPAIAPFADLRPVTSSSSSESQPCGGGTINLTGLTLETPPTQSSGGGFNSTFSVGTISLASPLANGAPVDVVFTSNIMQAGNFRYLIIVEALP
jgi:hypothetical protein